MSNGSGIIRRAVKRIDNNLKADHLFDKKQGRSEAQKHAPFD
jgi:hypothetical protein